MCALSDELRPVSSRGAWCLRCCKTLACCRLFSSSGCSYGADCWFSHERASDGMMAAFYDSQYDSDDSEDGPYIVSVQATYTRRGADGAVAVDTPSAVPESQSSSSSTPVVYAIGSHVQLIVADLNSPPVSGTLNPAEHRVCPDGAILPPGRRYEEGAGDVDDEELCCY